MYKTLVAEILIIPPVCSEATAVLVMSKTQQAFFLYVEYPTHGPVRELLRIVHSFILVEVVPEFSCTNTVQIMYRLTRA